MAHDIFRHSHKTVAGIDAAVRAHGKGVLHAVDEGADRTPAGQDTASIVVDVSHLNLVHVLQIPVHQIDQEISVLFRGKSPPFRLVALQ